MKINAIITAGGTSSRFGKTNKLLEKIHDKEIIKYTVESFDLPEIDRIIITANPMIIETLRTFFTDNRKVKIVTGGTTRQQSVYNGLIAERCDYVLIHDGARPMISQAIIQNAIETVKLKKALTVMTKTIPTPIFFRPDICTGESTRG